MCTYLWLLLSLSLCTDYLFHIHNPISFFIFNFVITVRLKVILWPFLKTLLSDHRAQLSDGNVTRTSYLTRSGRPFVKSLSMLGSFTSVQPGNWNEDSYIGFFHCSIPISTYCKPVNFNTFYSLFTSWVSTPCIDLVLV